MHAFISWCLYVSWVALFLSVVCILKWLQLQPRVLALRQSVSNTENSTESATLEKIEKGMRVAIKVLLVMSIVFLILHFVFMVNNQ